MMTDDFYMFYFFVTFVHLVHVIVGLVILSVLMKKVRGDSYLPAGIKWLESAATYWHMVDLLWVMIFALFYLISWQ